MRISDWSSDVCSSDLAAAVARSAPAMIGAVLIAARVAPLRPLALFAFLLVEALKIVPVAVIFRRMVGAEIPAFAAIGRFGRGTVAGPVATMPVAQAHLLRLTRCAIAAPAGKTPVV